MIIGIFGQTMKEGKSFLDDVIGNMKYKDVEYFIRYPYSYEAKIKDGTIYRVLTAGDPVRGHRIDKAIISKDLSIEFMTTILPALFIGDIDVEYFN